MTIVRLEANQVIRNTRGADFVQPQSECDIQGDRRRFQFAVNSAATPHARHGGGAGGMACAGFGPSDVVVQRDSASFVVAAFCRSDDLQRMMGVVEIASLSDQAGDRSMKLGE